MTHRRTPDLMPVLSRGKHRNPSKGACFMEFASFLAGERWSDHPDCTHPLLAALARDVNDYVGDEARLQIMPLVPSVIGLNGSDPRITAWLARDVALTALPVVSSERQGVTAVGLYNCERVLNRLDGLPPGRVSDQVAQALNHVPHAVSWARGFCDLGFGPPRDFSRRAAPTIVHVAVSGIAGAAVADPDRMLVELLERSIANCRTWLRQTNPAEAASRSGDSGGEVTGLRRPRAGGLRRPWA